MEINNIKIPKSFFLYSRKFKVEFDKKLIDESNWTGMAAFREKKIKLQPLTEANNREQIDVEQTFFHELTHWILHEAEYEKLNDNEIFVERFSKLLHQALSTAEYEEPNDCEGV